MEEFWLDLILRLGFPIVVVLMMVKGWLVPGFIYQRVIDDNDRLTETVETKVIPALIESNRVISEATEALAKRPVRRKAPDA